jgi:hypothetical protein
VSDETSAATPPILAEKHYEAPSVFDVANLMREARRQKRLPAGDVPPICVLDPDGDLVDYLRASGQSRPYPAWACYHYLPSARYSQLEATLRERLSIGSLPPTYWCQSNCDEPTI